MGLLVHLPLAKDWGSRCDGEGYRAPELEADGYIPLCSRDLAPVVSNSVLIGTGPRLIVAVDPGRLSSPLRREPVVPGTYAWPHPYGPLDLQAVVGVEPYPCLASGRFGPVPEPIRALDDSPDYDGEVGAGLAVEIVRSLAAAGAWVVLDGGWGLDALLGRQTRRHGDLDLSVRSDQVEAVQTVLSATGFALTADQRPTRIELRRADGASVDLHPLELGPDGGTQVLPDGTRFLYPTGGLAAKGSINGELVPCISAELQLVCHSGYEPGDNSYMNMARLAEHFGIKPPWPYSEALPSD